MLLVDVKQDINYEINKKILMQAIYINFQKCKKFEDTLDFNP